MKKQDIAVKGKDMPELQILFDIFERAVNPTFSGSVDPMLNLVPFHLAREIKEFRRINKVNEATLEKER